MMYNVERLGSSLPIENRKGRGEFGVISDTGEATKCSRINHDALRATYKHRRSKLQEVGNAALSTQYWRYLSDQKFVPDLTSTRNRHVWLWNPIFGHGTRFERGKSNP